MIHQPGIGNSPLSVRPEQVTALAIGMIGSPKFMIPLATPEGLEPPTLGSEDQCSIQLSYGAALIGNDTATIEAMSRLGWRGLEPRRRVL